MERLLCSMLNKLFMQAVELEQSKENAVTWRYTGYNSYTYSGNNLYMSPLTYSPTNIAYTPVTYTWSSTDTE